MKKSQTLREAKALIADPRKWTTGNFSSGTGKSKRYCALGALRAVSLPPTEKYRGDSFYRCNVDFLNRAAARVTATIDTGYQDIVILNDSGRSDSHDLVMRSYDIAIKLAEEQERINSQSFR